MFFLWRNRLVAKNTNCEVCLLQGASQLQNVGYAGGELKGLYVLLFFDSVNAGLLELMSMSVGFVIVEAVAEVVVEMTKVDSQVLDLGRDW